MPTQDECHAAPLLLSALFAALPTQGRGPGLTRHGRCLVRERIRAMSGRRAPGFIAAGLLLALMPVAATAQNLVANGSFSAALDGWTQAGDGTGRPRPTTSTAIPRRARRCCAMPCRTRARAPFHSSSAWC
jgi:hypothetical protein